MTHTFYFSVEGETEKRYLQWLEQAMNERLPTARVRFSVKIEKDPFARARGLGPHGDIEIIHFMDMESNEPYHIDHFRSVLRRMRSVEEHFPEITYTLGYCNYTFELWMILHRKPCSRPLSCRKDYLPILNETFGQNFRNLAEYKREREFSRILRQLSLEDVIDATARANRIEAENMLAGTPEVTAGYSYFLQNPAISLGHVIEDIMEDVGLMRKE